jgi:hypothetical protein
LAHSDFCLSGSLKNHLGANVSLMTKRMKRKCGNGWDKVKILLCCRFWHTGKAMGQVYQCFWRICWETDIFYMFEYHIL